MLNLKILPGGSDASTEEGTGEVEEERGGQESIPQTSSRHLQPRLMKRSNDIGKEVQHRHFVLSAVFFY